MNLHGKKYSIMGLARSGIAAADLLKRMGAQVFVSEKKTEEQIPLATELKELYDCEFGGHTERVLDAVAIVVSPGIPLNIPILQQARARGVEVMSEIELGFRLMHKSAKVIAVTGSNGKSTTVSLIHHLLTALGYNSVLAGNIGFAYTGFPIDEPGVDFYVLEISSFQLEAVSSFRPNVGVLLNITPDHLNRYATMADYAAAKANLFKFQSEHDLAVLNQEDPLVMKSTEHIRSQKRLFAMKHTANAFYDGKDIRFGDFWLHPGEFRIKGPHNIANVMAAVLAVLPYTRDFDTLRNAVNTFMPLSHRLEYVASVKGVDFVNDSKATNTDSVHYALLSFDRPVRIILGGSDKGEDYGVLQDDLARHAVKAYLIGETRDKMFTQLDHCVPMCTCDGFKAAIDQAFHESKPGDIVLLSPACASFDMFRNFEERGEVFKKIVDGYLQEIGQ